MKWIYFFIIFIIIIFITSCGIDGNNPKVISTTLKNEDIITDVDSFDSITITFSNPMNMYITETNISIEGYYGDLHFEWFKGKKSCILYLLEKLERGKTYTLRIDKSCETEDGKDLGVDYKYRFHTFTDSNFFIVEGTYPNDGANGVVSSIDSISINFSLPIAYVSIYDKIDISPEIDYYYHFSDDRKSIFLIPVRSLEKNDVYNVTIKKEIASISGKKLERDYTFSFSTVYSNENFELIEALMVQKGGIPSDPHISINTDYLSETEGIDKDMELILGLNSDFFLNFAFEHITIEPSIPYSLAKEDNSIRVTFKEAMESEMTYTISLDSGFKNIDGKPLIKDYKFSWIVNEINSSYLKLLNIWIKDPDGINDTLIYSNGEYYQNESMLLQPQIDHQEVAFEIEFSSPIQVYRALNFINLDFMFGNSQGTSGEMVDYSYSLTDNTLTVTFSLPSILSGDDAYYKLELIGDKDGILDVNNNPMEGKVSIYTVYTIQ